MTRFSGSASKNVVLEITIPQRFSTHSQIFRRSIRWLSRKRRWEKLRQARCSILLSCWVNWSLRIALVRLSFLITCFTECCWAKATCCLLHFQIVDSLSWGLRASAPCKSSTLATTHTSLESTYRLLCASWLPIACCVTLTCQASTWPKTKLKRASASRPTLNGKKKWVALLGRIGLCSTSVFKIAISAKQICARCFQPFASPKL